MPITTTRKQIDENWHEKKKLLKIIFAGMIEQMLESGMDEHLGYEKNSIAGNNSENSGNGYGKRP